MAIKLYTGDCLKILKRLEAGSIDAVVTDPPYGVGLKARRAHQRQGGVSTRAGSYAFDDTPFYVREVVVPAIEECRRIATSVLVTPGTRNMWLYPQPDDVGCFYASNGTGMGRWGFTCMQPVLYYGKCPYLSHRLGSRPNSSGTIYGNDSNTIAHPCAKPITMVRWLVERGALDGMTVLDPFMGSGTTGVACVQLGRSFIGIEIDPTFVRMARRRIAAARLDQIP